MKINKILESLKSGKISTNNAKKLLTLYSIEEVENFAKIDINRSKRRGVPAVIGKNGVKKIIGLDLNDEERQIFDKGVTNVKDAISGIKI